MVARCYLIVVRKATATYPLAKIKPLVKGKSWAATRTARDTALALGFDDDDIFDCVVNQLADTHFYKTMEADQKPGHMQDVYRITYEGQRLYVKLQIIDEVAIVISFKEDESGS